MQAIEIINEFDIPTTSKVMMVQRTTELLEAGKIDSPSVLIAIGVPLSVIPTDAKRADTVMQYTVSNLIDGHNVSAAFGKATQQARALLIKHPYLVTAATEQSKPVTDVKARAHAIWATMSAANAPTVDIVKKIAADTEITVANARYYVSRVFAKK